MKRTLTLLASLLVSSVVAADAPKRTPLKIDVVLSDRVKPSAPKVAPPAAPVSADRVMAAEILTQPVRAEQEAILEKLIATTPDTDVADKSDLYFRKGELHAKQHRNFHLAAMEAELKGDKRASAQASAQAKTELTKAVLAYKALTENQAFQNYPQMDLALFVYAYTLQTGGYTTPARAVYDKLLKNYPSSKYVPEAHLAFAEYYWEAGQLADAEARYRKVLEFKSSSVFWYATYKLGWVQLNRAKFSDALETFFQVAQATRNDAKRDVLYRNAKKDFVRAYAEIGKTDKALVAFKRVDDKGAFDMLATLAGFYMEQGKSDKAIYTYRELMKLAPKHAQVCNWQYEVAHATLSLPGASVGDKVGEIDNLAQLYRAVSLKKTLPTAELQDCRDNTAALSGELARAYHAEWAKTYSADSYTAAAKLYSTYLATFPKSEDTPMTRYYQADLLWSHAEREPDARKKTQQWEDTAAAFVAVVQGGGLQNAQLEDAAYAAVSAYLRAHDSDPRAQVAVSDVKGDSKADAGEPEPKPIPEREQRMLAAFDLYLTRVKAPREDDLVQMMFLKANVLRRFDHLAEAVPIFQEILDKHTSHEAAEDAAVLLLDTYIRQNNEAALIKLTDQLLANKQFLADRPALAGNLDKIKTTWLRKRAEGIEARARKSKDFALLVECGQAYLAIYNKNPTADANDEVLYNAGVCFEDGRSLFAALRMYQLLERFYPASPHTARAIARSGRVYADVAMYEDAAAKLEQYAKKYGGEQNAYDAMNDAVFYFKGTGNDTKAIEDTNYFVRTFGTKKPTEAAAAAFSLTAIYEKQGDTDALIKHLRGYIKQHGERGGAAALVIANAKLGTALFDQSCPVKTVDGACVKISRERAVASRRNGRERGKTQCGPDSKIKLTVVPRDARLVREALAAFGAAQRAFAKVATSSPDFGTARHFAGTARLGESTVDLEAYFTLAFPANLDFDPRQPAIAKQSLKRFDTWLVDKEAAARKAATKLASVLELKDSASSIAAAARIGQISQHFADALFTAEIPKNVRTGPYAEDKIEAYCDVLTEKAEPLASRALDAYGTCLAKSTELGWFSEWSQLCERELGQIQPDRFPTASERRSDPDRLAVVVASEPPPRLD